MRPSKTIKRDWNVSLGSVTFGTIIESGNTDPGGGITYPAKYSFDVTAAPDCTNDFVVMGLPATPASGGQANIVAFNNLYSEPGGTGFCSGTGPNVLFAYASGAGEVPAPVAVSLDGKKVAYIEDLLTGSSYFHVLKWEAGDGTDATHAIVPGSGNPSATDLTVLLSPDGGTTNQSSTTAPWIDYTTDAAYVTTYSWTASSGSGGTGTGSSYLYKISPVFGVGTPAIVWSVQVACGDPSSVLSSPVYDTVSSNVFFTDTGSRLDFVNDPNNSTIAPAVSCGSLSTFDNTAANAPVVDSASGVVYYTLNSDGTNEKLGEVEAGNPTGGSLGVTVGVDNTTYTSPYNVDFSNDYYNCVFAAGPCTGNPLLYLAATDPTDGTVPALYTWNIVVGDSFPLIAQGGAVTSTNEFTAADLATGPADSSPVTEFFNDPDGIRADGTDFLFVGVSNNCPATVGGSGGCVMSFNITNTSYNSIFNTWANAPTPAPSTTALAAPGGPTGIIVDNDSTDAQASNIYYATKGIQGVTNATLVKATQAGLN